MNDWLLTLRVEHWKPVLGALLLPPVPFIAMVLTGLFMVSKRRILAWFLVLSGSAGLWLMGTSAAAVALERGVLRPPAALTPAEIAALKQAPRAAIVVLGGGRIEVASEYGMSSLNARSIERLRYGIHLGRQTGLPVAFSGGVGYGARPGPSEAEVAARIAEREFGFKLRWTETASRDTRENALRSVALLRQQGVNHIVLVTQAYHMPRALKNFKSAAASPGSPMRVTAAPMDVVPRGPQEFMSWMPSLIGYQQTRLNLHEWLGLLGGA